jgi:hypothetical protein
MDRTVLDAYDWKGIPLECEFIPELEDDEEDEDDSSRPKKKKYRYRWPDEIRDEVLARLLELNRQRALKEGQIVPAAQGTVAPNAGNNPRKNKTGKKEAAEQPTPNMFAVRRGES